MLYVGPYFPSLVLSLAVHLYFSVGDPAIILLFLFLTFLFCIVVQLMDSVLLVSGVRRVHRLLTYMGPLFFGLFSHIGCRSVEWSSVLCSRALLPVCFKHGGAHTSAPDSVTAPPHTQSLSRVVTLYVVHVLCVHALYFHRAQASRSFAPPASEHRA